MLTVVFLVLLLAWTAVSENSCELKQTCSASFVNYDMHVMECPAVQSNDVSKSTASLNCLNNIQCKAIICNSSTALCSTCTGDQISSLSFNSVGSSYLKRRLMKLNMGYDPVTLGISEIILLPDRLTPGDLVYIRATVLKYDNFVVDLLIDDSNTYLHFRTRCDDGCSDSFDCSDAECAGGKHIVITSKANQLWSTSGISSSNYPFQLNQQFELHLLTLSGSVMCFINRKFYTSHATSLTLENIYGISVRGTVNVHEFSV